MKRLFTAVLMIGLFTILASPADARGGPHKHGFDKKPFYAKTTTTAVNKKKAPCAGQSCTRTFGLFGKKTACCPLAQPPAK